MSTNGLGMMRSQRAAQMNSGSVFISRASLHKSAAIRAALCCAFLGAALSASADGVSPYAGLWVGPVALKTEFLISRASARTPPSGSWPTASRAPGTSLRSM